MWRRVFLVVLLSSVGCERKPIFVLQGRDLGGVAVQCVAVTDFLEGLVQCNGLNPTNGGCRCAQPGVPFGLPPVSADKTEALGVLAFGDNPCNTISATTCVPLVIPTDPDFKDPHRLSKAQLQLDQLMNFQPEYPNQIVPDDIVAYAGSPSSVATAVATDAQNEVQADCKTAHYSVLTQILFGYAKGSLDWANAVPMVAEEFNAYTSQLNGRHLQSQKWGQTNPPAGVDFKVYATHERLGYACNAGMMVPDRGQSWGLAAVNDFNAPAGVANPPPKQNVSGRQSVVLGNGSSGLLSVSGISETASLDLSGGIEISLSSCSADNTSCTAGLSSLMLTAAPFSFQGYNVASLTISNVSASSGSLVDTTLVFTSISGTVRVILTDGSYDDVPIGTGVILATWDVNTRKAIMAFAFASTLMDGTEITINGTAFAAFDNTSPTAKIAVASPPPNSVAAGEARIECQSPQGTTVTLDGSQSSDREDRSVKLAWWENDFSPVARKSTASQLVLADLPVASQDVLLMAYDSRGYAASDNLRLTVVDTLGPTIMAEDICVFPPDKKEFCVRLGHELQVSAVDQCDGDVGGSIAIIGVTSSTGTGIVSFDSQKACLIADRSGPGQGTTYNVTVTATDKTGNTTEKTLSVEIPHNGPIKQCLRPQFLIGGAQ